MSMVSRPDRNPHWLSGMALLLFTCPFRRLTSIRASTLSATKVAKCRDGCHKQHGRSYAYRWASLKSCETDSCSQITQNSLCSWSSNVGPPFLSISGGIPSIPVDFLDAVCLRACSISVRGWNIIEMSCTWPLWDFGEHFSFKS